MSGVTPWVTVALYFVEKVDVADAESLSRLISTGDMINHAVLSDDEVSDALDDLSSRGWLEVDGDVCSLAPHAKEIVAAAVEEAGSPMASAELAPRLAAQRCFTAPSAPHPDPATFRAGVDAYVARMDALLKKRR